MLARLTLILTAALSLAFAPAPLRRPDLGKDDLKKLQGTWHRLTGTNGTIPPVPHPINDLVRFEGDRIHYNFNDAGGGYIWVLTLGKGKAPRPFEIRRIQPPDGNIWIGVYELDGDSFRMNFTQSKVRPTGIQPTRPGEHLQIFQRKR